MIKINFSLDFHRGAHGPRGPRPDGADEAEGRDAGEGEGEGDDARADDDEVEDVPRVLRTGPLRFAESESKIRLRWARRNLSRRCSTGPANEPRDEGAPRRLCWDTERRFRCAESESKMFRGSRRG